MDRILRIYLEQGMLQTALAGTFNFMNVLWDAVRSAGWQVIFLPTGPKARKQAPDLPGYALFHLEPPTHDRALTFRRAYHYPFWQIQNHIQRWRSDVALSRFDPASIQTGPARDFQKRLRARVLAGPAPTHGSRVLIALQGRLQECRSFQTMSPIEMVRQIARTGQPATATLHPNETYDENDLRALEQLALDFPNLTIGGRTAALLRDCCFVATQNSAVAFDGYLLGKPAVLFAQSDLHHIALNVADLGAETALARAPDHRPDFARYLFWFLQRMSINATAKDAPAQIINAMKKGGWPIGQPPKMQI